ncbi:Lactonase, 7-bladed beta-propeller-domain-containing protein [Pleurostoma richardsiae]|uniref:Lactonase, 7-bladed beta-propeller-domain-containing protein n=1 Tax=Pleurostoma richardsiae TaxID=41990 RepID=A0AA38VH68_9PEZI|nr:Lactonase, 7-bladed beta-propeller-domain-containing protein [Pleurostoma richardsiae]
MLLFRGLLSAAGVAATALPRVPLHSSATALLYVSSYAGTITTLNLTVPGANTTEASLLPIASTTGCAPNPSWLTLDYPNSVLYCLDEGLSTPNGTLSSYKTSVDGSLVQLDKVNTISGPVSAVIYGACGRGLALAEYSGSSFASYDISNPGALTPVQAQTFSIPHPGPNPSRQDAPHPHEAVVDPTGRFLLVPDLGADLVRVFLINQASLGWTPIAPLTAPPGSGPRHIAWLVTKEKTFMYLVTELGNTILGYEVVYNKNDTLSFAQVYASSTHGKGNTVPAGATAAEVHLSPDSKFLMVSSRGEAAFLIPNFDPKNSTKIPSDSIISFSVDHQTGNLSLVQIFPAGGMVPRQFSVNKAGTLLAVGLQNDGRAVVIDRDTETGLLKGFVAAADIVGQVTSVIFDE